MRQGARIVVFTVAMLAASCGINTHLPASRLEIPETYGRPLAFGVDLGVQGTNSLSLTPDYTDTPVDQDMPSYSRSGGVKAGVDVGMAEWFDLGIQTGWDSPYVLQGKYQLLGEPQRTARQGNSSLAVTAAIGSHNQSASADDLFSGGDDAYEMRTYMADAAVIAGYRFADAGLVFGGPYMQKYWMSGTQILDDARIPYDVDAIQYGVNVGIAFTIDRTFQLMLEAVFTESSANDAHVRSGFLGGHLAIMKF